MRDAKTGAKSTAGASALVLLLIALTLIASACAESELPDDLRIRIDEATDEVVGPVEPGEYALPYSVENFAKYETKYDLAVTAYAFRIPENLPVEVKNNRTMRVASDASYEVVIRLSGFANGEPKHREKGFRIVAKKADRHIIFRAENGVLIKYFQVPYGTALDVREIPEIPNVYPSLPGFNTTIRKKYWATNRVGADPAPLDERELESVTEDIEFCPVYEYDDEPLACALVFDANGGAFENGESEKRIEGTTQTVPERPEDPVRAGYAFDCWCIDEECATPYPWASRRFAPIEAEGEYRLRARWIKEIENRTDERFFVFSEVKTDTNGNKYLTIKGSDEFEGERPKELILPSARDGIAIKETEDKAFAGWNIEKVAIPPRYERFGDATFRNCRRLKEATFADASESSARIVAADMFDGCSSLETIVLPDAIDTIRSNAFHDCSALKALTLPESLWTLNDRAFADCVALEALTIPNALMNICEDAFYRCVSLATLTFGAESRLEYVCPGAFDETGLKTVTFPPSMKSRAPGFLGYVANRPKTEDNKIKAEFMPNPKKKE